MPPKYLKNKVSMIFPLVLLGCGNGNSENYPNLANGFDEARPIPASVSTPSPQKSFDQIEFDQIEVDEALLKFENQKIVFENALKLLNQGGADVKLQDWYSAQLELSKLSRVAKELEKVLRAGKTQGRFINKGAYDKNVEIEEFMKANLLALSNLKP